MVFLTGFPGFLASGLVPHLLDRLPPDVPILCLVQSRYRALAEHRAAALEAAGWADGAGRLRLIEGDLTLADLGLGERLHAIQRETTEIFHLAAVYDLAVPRALAHRVNVDGTRHLLGLAAGCRSLRRLHHVSTCYVSGHFPGPFTEDRLVEGQLFNNHYEETKYLAEVEVQARMRDGLPATIYRPAIVVGDSHTGATQKYDGPYAVIQWLLRWPRVVPMPVTGAPERFTVNVVPRDFVVEAIARLSRMDASEGAVYQLADPQPLTVQQMLEVLGRATDRHVLPLRMPAPLLKAALRVPFVQRWTGFSPASVDYFAHPTHYTTDHARRDLDGTGITCPPFAAYAPRLVDFVRAHPDLPSHGLA